MTQKFRQRYIWVDALCIVQDDNEDKMHEIQRMHEIYSQAELTIVAATGDGANSGLEAINPVFQDRPHDINTFKFMVDPGNMRGTIEFST